MSALQRARVICPTPALQIMYYLSVFSFWFVVLRPHGKVTMHNKLTTDNTQRAERIRLQQSLLNAKLLLEEIPELLNGRDTEEWESDDDSSVSSSESSSSTDTSHNSSAELDELLDHTLDEVQDSVSRVYGHIQDSSIQFGQMKTVADFNDSECQLDFRFRKADFWKRCADHFGLGYNHELLNLWMGAHHSQCH